jgi:hypothetical protein
MAKIHMGRWVAHIGRLVVTACVSGVLICGTLLLGMIWAAFWELL